MSNGFTLIELMVVMVIMGTFTTVIAVAYPNARAEQKLTLTEQAFQAALREAQQLTINEDRESRCVETFASSPEEQKLCSDIGVALDTTNNEFIIFADTNDPTGNEWNGEEPRKQISFPEGVQVSAITATRTFVFQGTPPTVSLFIPGRLDAVDAPLPVTFEVGRHTRGLNVLSYGQVERQ